MPATLAPELFLDLQCSAVHRQRTAQPAAAASCRVPGMSRGLRCAPRSAAAEPTVTLGELRSWPLSAITPGVGWIQWTVLECAAPQVSVRPQGNRTGREIGQLRNQGGRIHALWFPGGSPFGAFSVCAICWPVSWWTPVRSFALFAGLLCAEPDGVAAGRRGLLGIGHGQHTAQHSTAARR